MHAVASRSLPSMCRGRRRWLSARVEFHAARTALHLRRRSAAACGVVEGVGGPNVNKGSSGRWRGIMIFFNATRLLRRTTIATPYVK